MAQQSWGLGQGTGKEGVQIGSRLADNVFALSSRGLRQQLHQVPCKLSVLRTTTPLSSCSLTQQLEHRQSGDSPGSQLLCCKSLQGGEDDLKAIKQPPSSCACLARVAPSLRTCFTSCTDQGRAHLQAHLQLQPGLSAFLLFQVRIAGQALSLLLLILYTPHVALQGMAPCCWRKHGMQHRGDASPGRSITLCRLDTGA